MHSIMHPEILIKLVSDHLPAGDIGATLAALGRGWHDAFLSSGALFARALAAQLRRPMLRGPEAAELYSLRGATGVCCGGTFEDRLEVLWGPSGRACLVWCKRDFEKCRGWVQELVVLVPVSPEGQNASWVLWPQACRTLSCPPKSAVDSADVGGPKSWLAGCKPEAPVKPNAGGQDVCCRAAFCVAAACQEQGGGRKRHRLACSGAKDLQWLVRHLGLESELQLMRVLVPEGDFYSFPEAPNNAGAVATENVVDHLLTRYPYGDAVRKDVQECFENTWPGRMFLYERTVLPPASTGGKGLLSGAATGSYGTIPEVRATIFEGRRENWWLGEVGCQTYVAPKELFARAPVKL